MRGASGASLLVATGVVAGCGRLGFDDNAPGADGATAGVPVVIAELSGPESNDDHAALTADRLEIYFSSDRDSPGSIDIYVSTRESVTDAWGQPVRSEELSSPSADLGVGLSSDALTIYLTSFRPGGDGMGDVWMATRASRTATWSTPVYLPGLSTPDEEHVVRPDPTHTTLVLGSNSDVYMATRPDPASPWGTPVRIDELSTLPFLDSDPHLVDGGRVIFFDSDRVDDTLHIYRATRASPAEPFGAPVELRQLGAAADPWVSEAADYMVFRARQPGRDDTDLFEVDL